MQQYLYLSLLVAAVLARQERTDPTLRPEVSLLHELTAYEIVAVTSAHFERQIVSFKSKGSTSVHVNNVTEHPVESGFMTTAFGHHFDVRLHRNDRLFASGYFQARQEWDNGKLLHSDREEMPISHNCHYQGRVVDGESSIVAVSTCDGAFSGWISAFGEQFSIDAASRHLSMAELRQHMTALSVEHESVLHLMWRRKDMQKHTYRCGVADGSEYSQEHWTQHFHHSMPSSLPPSSLSTMVNTEVPASHERPVFETLANLKTVEFFIVNDYLRTKEFGHGTTVEQDSAALANIADALYASANFDYKIKVTLIGQISWTKQDPYPITPGDCPPDPPCTPTEVDVNDLLSKFHLWRVANLPHHDNAQLLSGFDFAASVLGYAGVGVMCYASQSGGIVQATSTDRALTGAVIAHEMGHNFGMLHDSSGNPCPTSGFVMNAEVDTSRPPTQFSACSVKYLNEFMNPSITCLDNEPTVVWGDPVCGNGYLEGNETCDCGSNCAQDTCCDGAICQLKPFANCSALDPCCTSTCKYAAGNKKTVCREASGVCDLPEYCTGTSSLCPRDDGKGTGTACVHPTYGNGMCHENECLSLEMQCRTLGANIANGPWSACPNQADNNNGEYCGVMWCVNQAGGRCSTFRTSSTSQFVWDGVPCDNTHQCLRHQCVSSESMNSKYSWIGGPWSPCLDCEDPQTRSIICADRLTGQEVEAVYCSPGDMPATRQLCQNDTLGCVHFYANIDGDELTLFGYTVKKNALIFGGVGAVAVYFIIIAICYNAVTWGNQEEDQLLKDEA